MGDYTRPFFGGSLRSNRKVLHSHMDSQGLNQSTCWHFASLIWEVLKINSLSKGSVVKLHTGIYSTVEVHIEQVEKLKTSCQHFFNANCLLLNGVTSTVRTIGHKG